MYENIVCVVVQEEQRDNLTVSVMSFVPTLDDDEKPITCRAENPNVTSLVLDTSWTINVVCEYPLHIYELMAYLLQVNELPLHLAT